MSQMICAAVTKQEVPEKPLANCADDIIDLDSDCQAETDAVVCKVDTVADEVLSDTGTENGNKRECETVNGVQNTPKEVGMDSEADKRKKKKSQCPNCSYETNNRFNYQRHVLLHQKPFRRKCDNCNYIGKSFKAYSSHARQCQPAIQPYKCDMCDYETGHSVQLERHKKAHQKVVQLVCQMCHDIFGQAGVLRKHMLKHGREVDKEAIHEPPKNKRKLYQCEVCLSEFNRSSRLKKHMLTHESSMHETNGLHKCFDCPYQCARIIDLMFHVDRKHRICIKKKTS